MASIFSLLPLLRQPNVFRVSHSLLEAEKKVLHPYNPVWPWIINISEKKGDPVKRSKERCFPQVTTPWGMALSSNRRQNSSTQHRAVYKGLSQARIYKIMLKYFLATAEIHLKEKNILGYQSQQPKSTDVGDNAGTKRHQLRSSLQEDV